MPGLIGLNERSKHFESLSLKWSDSFELVNGCDIDFVLVGVGSDEFHVDVLHPVSNCYDKSVVVAFYIKNDAVVCNDACARRAVCTECEFTVPMLKEFLVVGPHHASARP